MSQTKYGVHPSQELLALFSERPYQGQQPERASVLILGNDANYSPAISEHPFFSRILDYHADGVRFWTKNGKHHPFLLADYPFDRRTGGVKYHANFAKLGFTSQDAGRFSFIELLNVPTTGNTGQNRDLFFQLLDRRHLSWLEDAIFGSGRKFVLVNQTLARIIGKIRSRLKALPRLAQTLQEVNVVPGAVRAGPTVLYCGYSFSHTVSNAYLAALAASMREFMGECREADATLPAPPVSAG